MKRRFAFIFISSALAITLTSCSSSRESAAVTSNTAQPRPQQQQQQYQGPQHAAHGAAPSQYNQRGHSGHDSGHDSHSHPVNKEARVPAFQEAASIGTLRATLAPESFDGKVRQAYAAVREIPKTIAQLPCYCYCDSSFGHKSLHSCFVDNHAAHCGVCVDEALMAYGLQKEQKLSPQEIRKLVIAKYGSKG